jgi:hypothetical protein
MYRAAKLLSERKQSPEDSLPATSKKLVIVPQISHVASAIPAIRCEIATITEKIASVAPELSLVAISDVMSNFSLVTLQLAAVAPDLSCILSKLATINSRSIVVLAPADNRVSGGGTLRRGVGSSNHQGPGKGGGSCSQFHHGGFSASFCQAARVCTVSTQ